LSTRLKFISKLSANLIHSIIEPDTKIIELKPKNDRNDIKTAFKIHGAKKLSKIIEPKQVMLKFNHNTHRYNTGAETDPNPNTWREDEPRHPQPTKRPATTAPPGSSTAQAANPARSVVEEPTVPRKIMEKF
jgi:hypothetical protein